MDCISAGSVCKQTHFEGVEVSHVDVVLVLKSNSFFELYFERTAWTRYAEVGVCCCSCVETCHLSSAAMLKDREDGYVETSCDVVGVEASSRVGEVKSLPGSFVYPPPPLPHRHHLHHLCL